MVIPTTAPTRRDAAEASNPALLALLDTPAAARRLGVGKRTVQELVADRKLACVKIGRAVRFDPADLAAFVEANKIKAAGWKGGRP
jgi:excisionase family DNA binding protein